MMKFISHMPETISITDKI